MLSLDLRTKIHPGGISPLFGPVSGGTKLTVLGQELEVNANPNIYIGELLCKQEKGDIR